MIEDIAFALFPVNHDREIDLGRIFDLISGAAGVSALFAYKGMYKISALDQFPVALVVAFGNIEFGLDMS